MIPSILRPLLVTSFAINSSFVSKSFSLISPNAFAASSRLHFVSAGMSKSSKTDNEIDVGYLNAEDAYNLDVELMSAPGFTLEQLMELAGLSVAQVVYKVSSQSTSKTLVVCGPGNNGGDGLVAARHLVHFGHNCIVVYPKRPTKQPHYMNLVKSCEDLDIPILDAMPKDLSTFDIIVDAIFGFSFTGTPREPFNNILNDIMVAQRKHNTPIVSVDVPSGWNVDEGDINGLGFMPDILISLTAPKLCSKSFRGRHFCGGRFLPYALAEKYHVSMPPYPGTDQYMELKPTCKEEK